MKITVTEWLLNDSLAMNTVGNITKMNCLLLPSAAFHHATSSESTTSQNSQALITDSQQMTHILEVLKAREGDSLKIGEQGGNLGTGTIASISPDGIKLSGIMLDSPPPPKLNLTVVLALPRPKVLRRLIMDMTALGVNHIVLINSYRTQKSYWQSPLLSRLEEFVLEGLQQACDTHPPTITLKKRFKPFVEDELAHYLKGGVGLVAHPYALMSLSDYIQAQQPIIHSTAQSTAHSGIQSATQSAKSSVLRDSMGDYKGQEPAHQSLPKLLCVGAEGGWIDYEVEMLQEHGCQSISLGPRILRTEAAVNVLIGQWLIGYKSPDS